ncbi:MAG: hypothetical protein IJ906_10830 [Oscillospiraceae bacterium]|nr:hypothetical protein [Oscillospiraceae bacterium]
MKTIETIKKTLESYLPPEISSQDVIWTEMTLAVLEQIAPEEDAQQAYLLLHQYTLIGIIPNTAEAAFLQKAHVRLRTCRSKQNWTELIAQYREAVPSHIRFYELTETTVQGKSRLKLSRNPNVTIAPERAEIYLDDIRQYQEQSSMHYAKAGTYRFRLGTEQMPWAEVTLPSHQPKMPSMDEPKRERSAFIIPIEKLHQSAAEMQQIYAEDYCAEALATNTIKTVSGTQVIPAEELCIQDVVNMVGMVGSGKSTLMKVLSYHLAKQQKRVVLVLDTVADTLQMYAYFRKLQLNAVPLIGHSEREKYIYQVARKGAKSLLPEYSEYLTAACIVAGMAQTGHAAPHFGKEPCRSLIQNEKRYTCPYLDICPANKMYRDVLTADIIVTTVQGLASARIPGQNRLFLDYVLEQADLVIFDECDKAQNTLDTLFTPSTDFATFMESNAEACAVDMKREPDALDSMGINAIRYSELRLQALSMSQRVRETIQSVTGTWAPMLRKTFSAMTLYQQLCEDSENEKHPLTKEALQLLETAMQSPEDDGLIRILENIMQREKERKCVDLLRKWLEQKQCRVDSELLQHIKLYLIITQFDSYIRSLDEAYSFISEEQKTETELFNFMQTRFIAQQKRLPSAVMGNLFGMRNDPKKGLQLYRQYAFGRALMNRMPWLRLTETGKPAGPHVLLLSGSSWADGCLEYHVNVPVRYLLEADNWKREKLAQTQMIDLNTGVRVSGGGQEERREHLQEVIRKCLDSIEGELENDGKILMIVNSYVEAKDAAVFLNGHSLSASAAYMVRADEESDLPEYAQVLRGEVGTFDSHPARILVAPARAIERGYNIVNENGHSTFGSVFFLVRPMAVPDEIASKCAKLNGIIESHFYTENFPNSYAKSKALRKEAVVQWRVMEEQSRKSLTFLNETMKKDITAGLFILILQIFGRLARITEKSRPAPRVYFADGAFRTSPNYPDGYDCLNELRRYLKQMMQDPNSGEIARTLYAPFYEAFERGVNENVYIDYPDGDEAEDQYTF